MELRSGLFTIDVQTFQMVSIIPIPMYSLPPFGISNIVVHINDSRMYPSQNSTCITLTTLSDVLVSGSFSLVAPHSHDLRCSAFISNGPPALLNHIFLTAAAIYPNYGGPSAILTGCTSIVSGSPYGGRYLYRSYRRVEVWYSCYLVGRVWQPLDSQYHL